MTTNSTASDLSVSRLTASRKALVRQMAGRTRDASDDSLLELNQADSGDNDAERRDSRSSMWQVLTQGIKAWWHHHPARLVFDIGRPFVDKYAREKPLFLLGVAASVGAVAVVAKPWRLVSLTGLALALLKSPKFSNTLMSLLPSFSPRQGSRKARPKLQKDI